MFTYPVNTPAFQRWNAGVPRNQQNDWQSYQAYLRRVDQFLGSLELLWPEFTIQDGFVLRVNNIPHNWQLFMNQAQEARWSPEDIEYVINHIHLYDVFMNDPDRDQIDITVFSALADAIAEMWKCRLNSLFPDRQFMVIINDRDKSPEIGAYTIRNT